MRFYQKEFLHSPISLHQTTHLLCASTNFAPTYDASKCLLNDSFALRLLSQSTTSSITAESSLTCLIRRRWSGVSSCLCLWYFTLALREVISKRVNLVVIIIIVTRHHLQCFVLGKHGIQTHILHPSRVQTKMDLCWKHKQKLHDKWVWCILRGK